MNHDRIHARKPTQDTRRWSAGKIEPLGERDGHCLVTVRADTDWSLVEPVVTFAVRELFVSRLDIDEDESPVGQRIWYRRRGR